MKPLILRFILFLIIIYLTAGTLNPTVTASPPSGGNETHFHGVTDSRWNKQLSDQFPNRHYARTSVANLNVGEPRTVRMIYFLPNNRSYNADVVQQMKDNLHTTQRFFAEQMIAHGYGKRTFRIETDAQGEPVVHRVDADRPHDHYINNLQFIFDEIEQRFDLAKNIYFILIDNHTKVVDRALHGGAGVRISKEEGWALLPTITHWKIVAHELGHAFGLSHDFRKRAYIMGYGTSLSGSRLSACDAEYLSVHPYFNPDTPIEEGEPPNIELLSPRAYPAGSQSVSVRLRINDSDGIHQVLLLGAISSLIDCRGLAGEKNRVVEFEYEGVFTETGFTSFSDLVTRSIAVEAVDTDGNSSLKVFRLIIPEDRVDAEVEIDIPDPNLRAAVAEAIGVSPSASIIRGWIAQLTYLKATEANISDLTGIEFATRLIVLQVWSNRISDLSPLAGLTNLRSLSIRKNRISDISPLAGLTKLTHLLLRENHISDISPLAGLTNLQELHLHSNSISDISPLARLTNLSVLYLSDNNISDISVLAGLTQLSSLYLSTNNISNLSAVAGLTELKQLHLHSNSISDISPLARLTNLFFLNLKTNFISDISPLVTNTGLRSGDTVIVWVNPLSYQSIHTHIPVLQSRGVTVRLNDRTPTPPLKILGHNQQGAPGATLEQPFVVEVRDQNGVAFAGVPVTFVITAGDGTLSVINTITDEDGRAQTTLTLGGDLGTNTVEANVEGISQTIVFSAESTPLPTTLEYVSGDNQSGLIGEMLASPFVVEVRDQYNAPMEGVTVTFAVSVGGGSLSDTSVDSDVNGLARSTLTLGNDPVANIVEVSVEGITETVTFNAVAELLEFDLALPLGISLIHVPLKVRTVRGIAGTIESIADLYDALGGAGVVNFLITYDSQAQEWRSFFDASDKDREVLLADDTGIIAGLRAPVSLHLSGVPRGTGGSGAINLNQGLNVVGLPLKDSRIERVSDLFALNGIGGNVPVIILAEGGEFKLVGRANDPGDIPITGGQAFIMNAQRAAMVEISGAGWTNLPETAAAPPMLTGIEVANTTPVLALRGSIVDQGMDMNKAGFRVTVKNFSNDKTITGITEDDEEMDYQLTVVDVETGQAARIGDILEISAQSSDSLIGVEPLQYIVTVEDVKRSLIQLPALVTYEIPAATELLTNYPNPFNPETWIPYRLAEDAFVTLTIYEWTGHVVRTLNVGHRIAAVYESESKAIYWDGRNDIGEGVASGVYFYHLSAGDYSATRKMVILK